MSIEGTFFIQVVGRSTTRAAGINVKGFIDQRVKMIDPDVELMERNFAGMNFIYEWKGTPFHLDKGQRVLGYLRKSLKSYFIKWKLKIEINLIESEVVDNAKSNFYS